MNPLPRLLLLGTLVLAPALFAADTFVGKVSFLSTPAKGKPTVMNQSMKGNFVRIETPDSPGAMIMDFAKMEMIMLMNEERMYMVMPIKPSDAPETHKETAAADPDIEVTGKTEKILGYTCSQIFVKDGKTISEVWFAEGLGFFAGAGHSGGGSGGMFGKKKDQSETAAKWERALKGKGGFPLRVINRNAAGKETSRMEVIKIEKGGVTDADFKPPADFEKFAMPDMGGLNPFK
jgi:hypothetical protein